MSGFYGTLAVIAALLGSVLMVLAVAVYESYLSISLVGGLSDTELGTLSAACIVIAICAAAANRG